MITDMNGQVNYEYYRRSKARNILKAYIRPQQSNEVLESYKIPGVV